ncbi:MAG: KGK domain-containing protein [Trichodesmium sp.]
MENQYEPLETDEVIKIEFSPVAEQLKLSSYFEILFLSASQFAATMKYNLRVPNEIKEQIFEKGVDCQVLKYGSKEWQSGKIKVKVTVEFCPDEPQEEIEENEAENSGNNNSEVLENEVSPLDDLRQKFNQEKQ